MLRHAPWAIGGCTRTRNGRDLAWCKEELKQRYRTGRIGDVGVKQRLSRVLNAFLAPFRARRTQYAAGPYLVAELLRSGRAKVTAEARQTLQLVRQALSLPASSC